MYQPAPGQAFGGIFNASLPETEAASKQVAQQLFMQQQARMAYAQRAAASTDNLMNREFTKVRSVDTPDVISSYQNYKQLKQRLLFDKSLQNNPQQYNEINNQANSALADTYQKINDSAEQKQRLLQLQQGRKSNATHDLFDDSFENKMQQAMGMKTDELKNSPLADNNAFLYQGAKLNLQDADKAARGTPQVVPNYQEVTPIDNISSRVQTYKYGANPAQYKQSLLGYLANNKGERGAAYELSQIDPSEIAATHAAYMNIPAQEWQRRTGQPIPVDVTPKNPNNKSEVFASYLAEKYALQNGAIPATPQTVVSNQAKINAQEAATQANQTHNAILSRQTHTANRIVDVNNPLTPSGAVPNTGENLVAKNFNDRLATAATMTDPTSPLMQGTVKVINLQPKEGAIFGSSKAPATKIIPTQDGRFIALGLDNKTQLGDPMTAKQVALKLADVNKIDKNQVSAFRANYDDNGRQAIKSQPKTIKPAKGGADNL